jgi:hypothetical protein
MATLTIGGQVREFRLTAVQIREAEKQLMREGGRPLLAAFRGEHAGFLGMHELERFLWWAWKDTHGESATTALISQYYAEGGTFTELHAAVLEALFECGAIIPKVSANGGPPLPLTAGTSA